MLLMTWSCNITYRSRKRREIVWVHTSRSTRVYHVSNLEPDIEIELERRWERKEEEFEFQEEVFKTWKAQVRRSSTEQDESIDPEVEVARAEEEADAIDSCPTIDSWDVYEDDEHGQRRLAPLSMDLINTPSEDSSGPPPLVDSSSSSRDEHHIVEIESREESESDDSMRNVPQTFNLTVADYIDEQPENEPTAYVADQLEEE